MLLPVLALVTACHNGVLLETDEAVKLIAKAEQALDAKQYQRVISMLSDQETYWPSHNLKSAKTELIAIAHVRSGNVDYGLRVLSRLAKKKSKSPKTQARYAEAMFTTGDRWMRWNAREILEKLEKNDLMPNADAWKVLAEIRRIEKDDEAFKRATTRCRETAKDVSNCPELQS